MKVRTQSTTFSMTSRARSMAGARRSDTSAAQALTTSLAFARTGWSFWNPSRMNSVAVAMWGASFSPTSMASTERLALILSNEADMPVSMVSNAAWVAPDDSPIWSRTDEKAAPPSEVSDRMAWPASTLPNRSRTETPEASAWVAMPMMASSNVPPPSRKVARPSPANSRKAVSALVPSLANSARAPLSIVALWAVGTPWLVRTAMEAVRFSNGTPTDAAMGATLYTSLASSSNVVLPRRTAVSRRSEDSVAVMASDP